jgi:RHS repeat-associated protein
MGRTTTYGYDENNRLLSRTYPESTQNVAFTYTPTGRRSTAVDTRGTTSFDYDLRDRLKSLTYADGRKLEYGYDGAGNRTSLTATVGGLTLTTAYVYDMLNRLETVTDPQSRTYMYGYDANGNRESLTQPNGTQTAYTYDRLNRLRTLYTTHPATGRTIQGYTYTLAPTGNRTQIAEADGTLRAYIYDALYRLTGDKVTVNNLLQYEKTFGYDPVGNRLSQATVGAGAPGTPTAPGTIAYGYDERDRLLTENGTSYGWDDNGNLVSKSGEATYTWDFENRLTKVTKADGTVVETAYDADGNRVNTKVTPSTGSPTTTHLLVDTTGSLSHVVAEADQAGALKAYYVRGDDLLALMRPLALAPATPADWQTRSYHADGIGSIRRLTDDNGQITDGYTYTAFGELLAHTGTDPQPYAFAGEPYDPNVGFQYHRARWMDRRVARFSGMDPWEGTRFDPNTLHRYLYAGSDPANRVDPTGRESLGESLTALFAAVTVWIITSPTVQFIGNVASALNLALFLGDDEYRSEFTAAAGGPAAAAQLLAQGAAAAYSVGRSLTSIAIALELTPAQAAASFQGSGQYPGVDRWRNIILRAGTVVYAGTPGVSGFFTTSKSIARSGNDAIALFEGLQVAPQASTKAYRPAVTAFIVMQDTPAAFGIVRANPQFGAGGYPQLFIPAWSSDLKPVFEIPLTNAVPFP